MVLEQELMKDLFSLALGLTVVAAQYGLDLRFGLGRRYEVDPGRTDML